MAPCRPESDGIPAYEVREQLQRVLQSDAFRGKEMLSRFLNYVVEAALAGRSDQIKQYSVGIDALGYEPGENPMPPFAQMPED